MDFGWKIWKFTKIIGKIHGSRKKKRGQSRITGKIKDSNSRFTKKIVLNSRITEKISVGQFTVHKENKTQFTVHSKNKSPITVHGNTSLRPSYRDLNIYSTLTLLYILFQHALPHIRKTSGCIINMASLVAQIGQKGAVPYVATKVCISAYIPIFLYFINMTYNFWDIMNIWS